MASIVSTTLLFVAGYEDDFVANARSQTRGAAKVVVGFAVASPMLPLWPLLAAAPQDVLMYHVGPRHYGPNPADSDTADAAGDCKPLTAQ